MSNFVILSGATPWSVTPQVKIKPQVTKVKTRKSAKDDVMIVNPIFLTFSKLTDDPYWQEIFVQASKGHLPTGFRYNDNVLTHRIRTRLSEIFLDIEHPETSFVTTKKFLMEKGLSLCSERDILEQKVYNYTPPPVIDSWTKFRGTKSKQIAISYYIESLVTLMKLNDVRKYNLHNVIWIGILANYFNTATIKVEDGKIVNIEGLKVDEDGSFCIDPDVVIKPGKKPKKGIEDLQSLTSTTERCIDENDDDKHKPIITTSWNNLMKHWDKLTRP